MVDDEPQPHLHPAGQRIDDHSAEKHYNFYFVNSSTTFSLPAKFYIDLSYRFQSRMDFATAG